MYMYMYNSMHEDMTSYVASVVCYCQLSSYTYVHSHVSLLTLCEVIAKKYCILYYTSLGLMQGSIVESCMPIKIIFFLHVHVHVHVCGFHSMSTCILQRYCLCSEGDVYLSSIKGHVCQHCGVHFGMSMFGLESKKQTLYHI